MTIYQVAVKGHANGQDVVNVLWYRDPSVFGTLAEYLGMANALAEQVNAQVIQSQGPLHVRGYGLLEAVTVDYTLDELVVNAWNSLFEPIASSPVTFDATGVGLREGSTNGPAPCINLRANLEPVLGPGFGTPKRGYLAIGPIVDSDIAGGGVVAPAALPVFEGLGDNLATNVPVLLPVPTIFFPIRVKVTRLLGIVTNIGYRDVSDFTVDQVAKFRRSRLPEA